MNCVRSKAQAGFFRNTLVSNISSYWIAAYCKACTMQLDLLLFMYSTHVVAEIDPSALCSCRVIVSSVIAIQAGRITFNATVYSYHNITALFRSRRDDECDIWARNILLASPRLDREVSLSLGSPLSVRNGCRLQDTNS